MLLSLAVAISSAGFWTWPFSRLPNESINAGAGTQVGSVGHYHCGTICVADSSECCVLV